MIGFFIVSIAISLGLLAWFRKMALGPSGTAGVCWLAAVLTFVALCALTPATGLQALLTFLISLGCLASGATPRTVVRACVVAMLASYALVLSFAAHELYTALNLRAQFPLESVSERLAYETAARGLRREMQIERTELARDAERRLSSFEDQGDWKSDLRRHSLAALHDRTRDEFVIARGFGPVRMMGIHTDFIELPSSEHIPLPLTDETHGEYEGASPDVATEREVAGVHSPGAGELVTMHDAAALDFVNPLRMGYVRDRDHVAGFQAHRFMTMPQLASDDLPRRSWQIVRLELVSLLKHEEPAAYVSKNLPQMDELTDAPTRPLDAFEQRAVARLRSDEDVVIDDSVDRIRMVGSLRAAKNCLDCHSVKRGDLLGVFTYELAPAKAAQRKPTPAPTT
jgi:hypothetical protein